MKSPSAWSVLFVLVGGGLCLAVMSRDAGCVRVDRSFLRGLAAMRPEPTECEEEKERLGALIWSNEEELRYLVRKGDAEAVRVAVMCAARGGVPGGCCCDEGFVVDLVASGAPTVMWEIIDGLPARLAVPVLCEIDRHPYGESRASSCWDDDRDEFLRGRDELRNAYRSVRARIDAWPAPS